MESRREEDKYNMTLPGQCFDLVMLGTEDCEEYLAQDKNNIVIVYVSNDGGVRATCYNLDLIRNGDIYFKCDTKSMASYRTETYNALVKITMGDFNIFITVDTAEKMLNSKCRYFTIESTNTEFKYTVSQNAIANEDYVSTDHCQAGSNKSIHDVTCRRKNTINELISVVVRRLSFSD